jgi:glucosyl-dolichyl phosphate glucuronosyltransferase
MDVTVILCTYNRSESLAMALESVAASQMPPGVSWKVLVVDNNSKDKTREVVEGVIARYPGRFEYAFEPHPGKSHALNLAINIAHSGILAFMDDDVQVEPDWLANLTSALENPSYCGVGGRILPERDFAPPGWLGSSERYAFAPLAMFDLGPNPGELKEPPFGTNMAFRREVFARFGDFRRDLGPQPGSEIRSEDTEFGLRVLRGGGRLWYEPSAVVYHAVPRNRVSQDYFLKWWFGKGRADVRESGTETEKHLSLFGVPLVLFRKLAIWTARSLFAFAPARRFDCKTKVWWLRGKIQESFAQARAAAQTHGSQRQSAQ